MLTACWQLQVEELLHAICIAAAQWQEPVGLTYQVGHITKYC